jgi:spermidine synthase
MGIWRHLNSHRRYQVALALALVSGSAGLTHQLLWTRRLVDVLGADGGTFARVIGAFFAGLAVGAWFASRPARSGTNFWRRVALAELAVALLALPALWSARLAEWAWAQTGFEQTIQLLAPAILILPPAIFMGVVLPWLLRALTHDVGGDGAVRLYALNILGGIGGIALVTFVGLPQLGLFLSGAVAVGLNLIAAGMAWCVAQHCPKPTEPQPEPTSIPEPAGSAPRATRSLAFASGFLVLAAEVMTQHQFAQVTINSMFSSATVLSLVLISLTVGALGVPPAIRWLGDERRVLLLALLAASGLWAIQPFLLVGFTSGLRMLTYDLSPTAYTLQVGALGMLTLAPPFVAAGVIFPLVLRSVAGRDDANRRREAGLLFAWNGLGGWLGAEAASAWLAPNLGLWGSVWWIAALYWVLAIACAQTANPHPGRARFGFKPGLGLGGLCLGITAPFVGSLPQASTTGPERLAAVVVAREGVVATVERGPDNWRILFNNAYSLGGSLSQFNQERQAHLPLLLHPNPRAAALLGVATGSTAAGAALHPQLERIDAIELSPAVLRFAREFFGPYNRNVFDDPRMRVIQADARWAIARQPASYDVVIGDLFLPWRTGEGRLFTIEHFTNVRDSLRPGGLFCQWLPLYQLTQPQYETILRTFHTVFPDVFLIRGDFYPDRPIVGLVGGLALNRLDWQQINAACTVIRQQHATSDPLVRHADGVAMLVVGPPPPLPHGPINTLANAWLEWDAGRNILGRQQAWFVGIPWADSLQEPYRMGAALLPERKRAAQAAGQSLAALSLAVWSREVPPTTRQDGFKYQLPLTLQMDEHATFDRFPIRMAPRREPAP